MLFVLQGIAVLTSLITVVAPILVSRPRIWIWYATLLIHDHAAIPVPWYLISELNQFNGLCFGMSWFYWHQIFILVSPCNWWTEQNSYHAVLYCCIFGTGPFSHITQGCFTSQGYNCLSAYVLQWRHNARDGVSRRSPKLITIYHARIYIYIFIDISTQMMYDLFNTICF